MHSIKLKQFQPVWREWFFHHKCNNFLKQGLYGYQRDYWFQFGCLLQNRLGKQTRHIQVLLHEPQHVINQNIACVAWYGSIQPVNMTFGYNKKAQEYELRFITIIRLDCIIGCDGLNWMILIGIWRYVFHNSCDCHNIEIRQNDGKCDVNWMDISTHHF